MGSESERSTTRGSSGEDGTVLYAPPGIISNAMKDLNAECTHLEYGE